jgi:nitrogen fixation protein NifU and related proteins
MRQPESPSGRVPRCAFFVAFALRRSCGLAILSLMFSDAVLDHFQNPRNAGELPGATAKVEVSNPVCGDVLQLAVRMEGERIVEARFLCRGCTTSIACASLLTEQLRGRTLAEVRSLTAKSLSESLGGLPPATFHGAELAADAIETMLRNIDAKYR